MSSGTDISGRKINIPEHFFDQEKEYHLPKFLKHLPDESDEVYSQRVRDHLVNLPAEDFVKLGYLIDT